MKSVEQIDKGKWAPYFAISLFTGIRWEELTKLVKEPHRIKLDNNIILISAEISKTGKKRQILIQPNLNQWLTKYTSEIFPRSFNKYITTSEN
jgi:hypothetical protein